LLSGNSTPVYDVSKIIQPSEATQSTIDYKSSDWDWKNLSAEEQELAEQMMENGNSKQEFIDTIYKQREEAKPKPKTLDDYKNDDNR
jgi:hypothetical protein